MTKATAPSPEGFPRMSAPPASARDVARLSRQVRAYARLAAGQSARRLRSWNPPLEHINTALRNGGEKLLQRAREMEASNAYAARAVEIWSGYAVRDGIRPTIRNARARAAWEDWVDDCDFDEIDGLAGLQDLVAREVYVGGEAFVQKVMVGDRLTIKVLPSEMLPLRDLGLPSTAGGEVRSGIEFDASGRRAAYHFYSRHPGDLSSGKVTAPPTIRVPAPEVIHVYERRNAGQIRGLSRLAAGMIRLWLLDGYDDAELDRQRIAALFAAFVTRPADEEPSSLLGEDADNPGAPATADTGADDQAAVLDLAPALVQFLEPGEEITFTNPPQLQGQYEAFQYRNLLAVAAAVGVPYHSLTGDVEKANYSASRAAQLDFKVGITRFQNRCLIGQLGAGLRRWFLADAALLGRVSAAAARERWVWNSPRWDWVDPKADSEAAALEVERGFTSRRRVVESRGYSLEEIDREIEEDRFRVGPGNEERIHDEEA